MTRVTTRSRTRKTFALDLGDGHCGCPTAPLIDQPGEGRASSRALDETRVRLALAERTDSLGVIAPYSHTSLVRTMGLGPGARHVVPVIVQSLHDRGVIELRPPRGRTEGSVRVIDWDRLTADSDTDLAARGQRSEIGLAARVQTDFGRAASDPGRARPPMVAARGDVAISARGFEGSTEGETFEGAPLLSEGEGAPPPKTSSVCRSCTVDRQGHFRGHELLDLVSARLEGGAAGALWRPEDKGGRNTLRKLLEFLETERRWDGERLAAHLTGSVPADHACPVALLLPKARSAAGELHATGPRLASPAPRPGTVTPRADDGGRDGGVLDQAAGPRRFAAGSHAARIFAERAAGA
jgi:hypothetical protein